MPTVSDPVASHYELFKRLLPETQSAFFVLWWETIHRKPDGKFQHDSAAFRTLLELANAADQYPDAPNVRNLSLLRLGAVRGECKLAQ